jgi:hypothetical protein
MLVNFHEGSLTMRQANTWDILKVDEKLCWRRRRREVREVKETHPAEKNKIGKTNMIYSQSKGQVDSIGSWSREGRWRV